MKKLAPMSPASPALPALPPNPDDVKQGPLSPEAWEELETSAKLGEVHRSPTTNTYRIVRKA